MRVGAVLAVVLLAAVLVFGLGVMVGKRVTESAVPAAAPQAPPPSPAVAAPAPRAAAPLAPEQLTFYDRLSGRTPPAPVEIPPGQAPPQAGAAEPGAPSPSVPAAAAPPAAPPSRAAALPEPEAAPTPAPAAPSAAADPVARIRRLSGAGSYAVQVAAVNRRAAADETVARLRRQGFEVTTVTATVKGRTWYRVRVGPFPDQAAASVAAGIFRSALGLNAIVAQAER